MPTGKFYISVYTHVYTQITSPFPTKSHAPKGPEVM